MIKEESKQATPIINISERTKQAALQHFINGNILEMKENYAEAILEYQDALRLNPNSGVYYALAKSYLKINKLPQSLENINKAVVLDSINIDYNELLAVIYTTGFMYDSAAVVYNRILKIDSSRYGTMFNLARIYESSKPSDALFLYNKIMDENGLDWTVLVRIAEMNERMGNIEETAKSIEKLLLLDPSNVDLQIMLAETYLKLKMENKALQICEEALTFFPNEIDLMQIKAQAYIQLGEWSNAANVYQKIFSDPDVNFEAKLRIGTIYFNQSLSDSTLLESTKNLLETVDKDTTDWQVKLFLGEIAINQARDSAGLKFFEEAVSLSEFNSIVWIRIGGLLFDKGKYEENENFMQRAILNFPEDFAINLIYGLTLSQRNKNKDAKPFLQKAVDLNPNDFNAISALAFTLNQIDQKDEALVYLNKALRIDPENSQIWGMMGMIYNSKGMWNETDSTYKRAIELNPEDPLLLNNYAYALSVHGIRLEEALSMSQKALESNPYNASYLDTMGWIYFKMGNLEKAYENIIRAAEIEPENPEILDHLGDIYSKLGQKDRALSYWKDALNIDPDNSEIKEKIQKGEL